MRRSALLYPAAVLLPSLVLGVLALRSASEQRLVVERRTAELCQRYTDELAGRARRAVEGEQRAFVAAVDRLLAAEEDPRRLAGRFAPALSAAWPGARAAFAATRDGAILSPSADEAAARPEWSEFLADHRGFLSNVAPADVYQSAAQLAEAPADARGALRQVAGRPARKVVPGKLGADATLAALTSPWRAEFATLIAIAPLGALARVVRDEVQVLFWRRAERASGLVFGAVVAPGARRDLWRPLVAGAPGGDEHCLALLDEQARPVAASTAGCAADWRRPFVATEVGELLPHWEAALYLRDPDALRASARTLTLSLLAVVVLALGAIGAGTWLVALDTRRKLELAARKADFVTNVSHELKTPLTSIRLFADLLAEGRVEGEGRRREYLRIIGLEAERLTRFVDNVLDLARFERREPRLARRRVDLRPVVLATWEAEALRLSSRGFSTRLDAAPGPWPADADPEAVARVLVNLVANAEKYSRERREVTLAVAREGGSLVLRLGDRGVGVPAAARERIFDPFFRADDSLASGAAGAGLGLAIARRLAVEHGGALEHEPREGGGSEFVLRLPLAGGSEAPA